jgi:UDP-glucose 6-dehydrogenase
VGFGGSCFKKDILNLVYICRHYGLEEVAGYWQSVIEINDYQKAHFVMTMLTAMFNTLSGKRICEKGAGIRGQGAGKQNRINVQESEAFESAFKQTHSGYRRGRFFGLSSLRPAG